jgi:hypothetical protein
MSTYLHTLIPLTTIRLILWLLSLSYLHIAHADDEDLKSLRPTLGVEWIPVYNDKRHEIKAYIRREENKPFRSFKAEITLNTNLTILSRVLLDFPNYHKWYWKAKDVQLLKKVSSTHYLIYLVHDIPYELPDLDIILDAVIEPQTAHKNYITIKVSALPDYLPERPPLRRMSAEDMSIRITPIGKDKTLMEIQGYFEVSNTILPAWAANMIQRSAPYTVCLQLKRMTNLPEYIHRKSDIDFPIYEVEAH